jgi:hypothetical protein
VRIRRREGRGGVGAHRERDLLFRWLAGTTILADKKKTTTRLVGCSVYSPLKDLARPNACLLASCAGAATLAMVREDILLKLPGARSVPRGNDDNIWILPSPRIRHFCRPGAAAPNCESFGSQVQFQWDWGWGWGRHCLNNCSVRLEDLKTVGRVGRFKQYAKKAQK